MQHNNYLNEVKTALNHKGLALDDLPDFYSYVEKELSISDPNFITDDDGPDDLSNFKIVTVNKYIDDSYSFILMDENGGLYPVELGHLVKDVKPHSFFCKVKMYLLDYLSDITAHYDNTGDAINSIPFILLREIIKLPKSEGCAIFRPEIPSTGIVDTWPLPFFILNIERNKARIVNIKTLNQDIVSLKDANKIYRLLLSCFHIQIDGDPRGYESFEGYVIKKVSFKMKERMDLDTITNDDQSISINEILGYGTDLY